MKFKTLSRVFCFVLMFCVLSSLCLAYADSDSKTSAISESKSGVVRVFAEYDDGTCSTGSAFGVGKHGEAPQYFVTNSHVVLDQETKKLAKNLYILLDDKAVTVEYDEAGYYQRAIVDYDRVEKCEVINPDEVKEFPDVAIIKSEEPIDGRITLPLSKTSNDINDAQVVYALGYPGTTDNLTINKNSEISIVADVEDVTITDGIVSMKTTSTLFGDTDVILHSAPINHGNSGGPLIDEDGNVIGINTYLLDADSAQYVSIYIDYAISILDQEEIAYSTGESLSTLITNILIAVIVMVIVIATVLVSRFKAGAKQYVDASALRLQFTAGDFAGRRFELTDKVTIGRSPDSNIVFPTGTKGVGSHHCVINRIGNQIYITDLGSTYGTILNGVKKLMPNAAESIVVGDTVMLGSDEQAFVISRKGGVI